MNYSLQFTLLAIIVGFVCSFLSITVESRNIRKPKCDGRSWYLEMMDDGVFDQDFSNQQLKLVRTIENFFEKRQGSVMLDCDTLRSYERDLGVILEDDPSAQEHNEETDAQSSHEQIDDEDDASSPKDHAELNTQDSSENVEAKDDEISTSKEKAKQDAQSSSEKMNLKDSATENRRNYTSKHAEEGLTGDTDIEEGEEVEDGNHPADTSAEHRESDALIQKKLKPPTEHEFKDGKTIVSKNISSQKNVKVSQKVKKRITSKITKPYKEQEAKVPTTKILLPYNKQNLTSKIEWVLSLFRFQSFNKCVQPLPIVSSYLRNRTKPKVLNITLANRNNSEFLPCDITSRANNTNYVCYYISILQRQTCIRCLNIDIHRCKLKTEHMKKANIGNKSTKTSKKSVYPAEYCSNVWWFRKAYVTAAPQNKTNKVVHKASKPRPIQSRDMYHTKSQSDSKKPFERRDKPGLPVPADDSANKNEVRRLEELFNTKRAEYNNKIQQLEVQILKLENKILTDTLDKTENTARHSNLENQLLKLENELLRLNQSFADAQIENEKLKQKQKSQGKDLDIFKANDRQKHLAIGGNFTTLPDIISNHHNRIMQLSKSLAGQHEYIAMLEKRSKALEQENNLLKKTVSSHSNTMASMLSKLENLEQKQTNQQKLLDDALSPKASNLPKTPMLQETDKTASKTKDDKEDEKQQASDPTNKGVKRKRRKLKQKPRKDLANEAITPKANDDNDRKKLPTDKDSDKSFVEAKMNDNMDKNLVQTDTVKLSGTFKEDVRSKNIAPGSEGSRPSRGTRGNIKDTREQFDQIKKHNTDKKKPNTVRTVPDIPTKTKKLSKMSEEDKMKVKSPAQKTSNKLEKSVTESDKTAHKSHHTKQTRVKVLSKGDEEERHKVPTKHAPIRKKRKIRKKSPENQKGSGPPPKQEEKSEGITKSKSGRTRSGVSDGDIPPVPDVSAKVDTNADQQTSASNSNNMKSTLKKNSHSMTQPKYYDPNYKNPKDCYDYYKKGRKRDTSMKITLLGNEKELTVFCDMQNGGWTVIQRRQAGSLDFFRGWDEYKKGFGEIFGDHWLGNDMIHLLTNQDHYSLRIDMMDWDKKKVYAVYQHFLVDAEEEGYKLHISGYSGNAGDGLSKHNNMMFSTKDKDNDLVKKAFGGSCANRFKGAWWYYKCYQSNLNGKYYRGGIAPEKKFDGVSWKPWTGPDKSLKLVEIKVRPKLK